MTGTIRLRDRARKVDGTGVHRECSAEETYEQVRPHFRSIGLTRVADITGLDRVGIPVYNAVMPRSADAISIYSGKGLRAADARTSAVMEAIERYAASLPLRPSVVCSFNDLRSAGRPVLSPTDHSVAVHSYYRDDQPLYWHAAWDLLNEEEVLVPQTAVGYGSVSGPPCHTISTSNGLASGNTVEEAVCHALCEVIERDSLTLDELVVGHLRRLVAHRTGGSGPVADQLIARLDDFRSEIDPESVPARARPLLDRFADAGIPIRMALLHSDIGVPCVVATAREGNGPSTSKAHGGYGCDPDVEVALIRAITECAQGRAVDIQATREDLELPDADVPSHRAYAKRSPVVEEDALLREPAGNRFAVGELPSYPSDDLVTDIRFMLDRLRACGMRRVLVVDVSPPEIPVHVVRVIVPGLESWGSDRSKIGTRATRVWNETVRTLRTGRPSAPVVAARQS
jgi:ribosomal protein S12 methylthiotransferase accessory factor